MEGLRGIRLALLVVAAVGLWTVALGCIPNDAAAVPGAAGSLVEVAVTYPWLLYLGVAFASWLGTSGLAGAPVSRRRLAVAAPLVAASLVPAVPELSHWTLYGVLGIGALAVTLPVVESLGAALPVRAPARGSVRARSVSLSFPSVVAAASGFHVLVTLLLCFALFGGIPHVQDSIVQLFQARIFLAGSATVPVPPVAEAFEYSHMVEHAGRWLSIYPPGHSLLLVAGLALGLPQLVNPLAGGVALVGTALLARDLLGERGARWALLFLLVSPFWLLMHAGFMSHATTHAVLVWAVYWWRWGAARNSRWAGLGAGGLLGLAFAIRPYTALLVGFGLLAAALVGEKRRRLTACAWTVAGALPGLALVFAYNVLTTSDPLLFGYLARFGEAQMPGFHPAPWGPPHTPVRGLVHVIADLNGLNRYLLAWPLPFTVLLGAAAAAGWRIREAWLATVPLALLAGHFFYWYADFCFGPRMVFESSFVLAILGAGSLDFLRHRLRCRLARIVALAVIGSLPLWAYLVSAFGDAYWGVEDAESRAVAAAAPEDALVFVTGNYGGYLWRNDPRLKQGPVYVRHRGATANRAVTAAFPDRVHLLQRGRELAPFVPGTRGQAP